MDNQPDPTTPRAACEFCKFVRVIPSAQNPLEKVLVCFFLPPTPMLAMTQHGPMLMPSTHAPVQAADWCFQFAAGERIEGAQAPNLLGTEKKFILNG